MPSTRTKISISAAALLLLVLHSLAPTYLRPDSVTTGLIVIAALPWIFSLIETAELPGGWKIHFRKLQKEQEVQRREIESLRFLVSHFITDHELGHLHKLSSGNPFPYEKSDSFVSELRRLRSLGLMLNQPNKTILTMPQNGDLRDHFTVTDRGRSYLKMRLQWENDREPPAPAA